MYSIALIMNALLDVAGPMEYAGPSGISVALIVILVLVLALVLFFVFKKLNKRSKKNKEENVTEEK